MLKGLDLYTVQASGKNTSFKSNRVGGNTPAALGSVQSSGQFSVQAAILNNGGSSVQNVVAKNNMVNLLDGFITDDLEARRRMYHDIYRYDGIAGSAVDVFSQLPFSSFDLTGIEDEEILEVYQKSCDNLRLKTLIPSISRDFLTLGAFIGTTLFDKNQKVFTHMMPQNLSSCVVTEVPIYGVDPIIDLRIPPTLKNMLKDKDPRLQKIFNDLPPQIRQDMNQGLIKLPPDTTLYLARKTLTSDFIGTSYLERMLPIHLYEKTLYRGTLDQANRRQRAILNLICGDDEWIPTQDDLNNITKLFQSADADPTGAIIATRNSIQANEIRCLAGKTLVSTEYGLKRIDDLVEHNPNNLKPDTAIPVDFKVKDRFGKFSPVKAWIYQGKQPVIEIKTSRGYHHTLTETHKLLVYRNGELIPVKVKDIRENDYVCVNTHNTQQITKNLSLNLHNKHAFRKDTAHIKLPSIMTPELAKLMAFLITDGCVRLMRTRGTAEFSNTNYENILEFKRCVKVVFNYDVTIKSIEAGKRYVLGKLRNCKKAFVATINTKIIVDALFQLGLKHINTKKKSSAHYKVIPWSILEADKECQFAFIAGYIMGDGGIFYRNSKMEIQMLSYSKTIMNNMQIMLANLGFLSHQGKNRVYLGPGEGTALYPYIQQYLNKRFGKFKIKNSKHKTYNGVPSEYYIKELEKRALRRSSFRKSDPTFPQGTWFLTDEGKQIVIPGSWTELFQGQRKGGVPFNYDNYRNGVYKAHLNIIKKVSKKLYANLVEKLELGYCYDKIVSRKNKGIRHTYDLSMKDKSEPTFTANSLLTRNSATDFFRSDEVDPYFAQAKYRCLGITEAIITGEFSISTLDATLSVLVDSFKAYREMLTRDIFYDKIFPAIAIANGFKSDEFTVRSSKRARDEFKLFQRVTCEDRTRSFTIKGVNYNTKNYLIPSIDWHKHLKPEGDTAYLELLASLGEKGVPVTLGMYAAAAGLNLDSIIKSMDPDLELRNEVASYLTKVNKINAKIAPQDQDGQQMQASRLAALASTGSSVEKVGLFNREFDDTTRMYERKKNGKYRLTSKRRVKEMEEDARKKIAAALANFNKKQNKRIRQGKPERPAKVLSSAIFGILNSQKGM